MMNEFEYDASGEPTPTGKCERCNVDVFFGEMYCYECDIYLFRCPECSGRGKDIMGFDLCELCEGRGRIDDD